MTHDELNDLAVRYLRTTGGFSVICKECHSNVQEIPDVYAINNRYSVVIECKTSHSDFERDGKKRFRRYPKEGLGRFRYYFCEEGVIAPSELPNKWGLIYVYPDGGIRLVKGKAFGHKTNDNKYRFQEDYHKECVVLYSLLRKATSWRFGENGIWKYNGEEDEC
jgi:hypothetical protein